MTKREWLANMTNEELADFLDNINCDICKICSSHRDSCDCECVTNIQNWLKSEIPEDELKIRTHY